MELLGGARSTEYTKPSGRATGIQERLGRQGSGVVVTKLPPPHA